MNSKYFDFDESYFSEKQLYQNIWSKKHISAWFFLRNAIRSSLIHLLRASSMWIQNCHKAKVKCNSPAERVLIANIWYEKFLSGPLLSTILLSASSIEAFARHCFVSTLRTKAHHIKQQELYDKFLEFDSKSPLKRIQLIISEVKANDLPAQIEKEINNLFGFRNNVMHSDPIYHTQQFLKLIQLKVDKKQKKTKDEEPRKYEYYPDLTAQNRPLSFTHSLLSTVTHDKLIEHVIGTSESADIMEFLNEIDMTNNDKGLIWGDQTFEVDYQKANDVARGMNTVNQELNRVTLKEKIAFLKKIKRDIE